MIEYFKAFELSMIISFLPCAIWAVFGLGSSFESYYFRVGWLFSICFWFLTSQFIASLLFDEYTISWVFTLVFSYFSFTTYNIQYHKEMFRELFENLDEEE
jgi:hypothetical protein